MLDRDFLITQVIGATRSQFSSPQERRFFIFKILFVIAIYIFLVFNSLHNLVSPEYVPDCVRDEMHELTLPINVFLEENQFYKSLLIIVASIMMDINVFVMAVTWIFFGKTYRTIFIILAFYVFRGFLQSVFFLKFPTNYIWGDPGLFSVTVPYHPANDFFYSGHLGLCVICLVHFTREKLKFMQYFGVVTIFVEFFTLLVTRAHYFIDLVSGMIIAHYIYLAADWIQEYLEKRTDEKKAKAKQEALNTDEIKEGQPLIEGKKYKN